MENIIEYLNKSKNNILEINITGFISSKFFIEEFEYNIQNDILNIKEKNKDVFLEINLNQVYQIEEIENYIKIYIDNDIVIKIKNN